MSDPHEPPNPLAVPGGPAHAPGAGGPEMSVLEHLEELVVKAANESGGRT